jgi:hypothetical protein
MNNYVYVTQNPMRRDAASGDLVHSFDLTSARQYGELHVLLPSGPQLVTTGPLVEQLRRKLATFSDKDHLLCLGDPVVIAMASAMVAELNDGVVPLLVWDRRVRSYNSVIVDIHRRLPATV